MSTEKKTEKRTVKLDPDQFNVDDHGKVTINSDRLAELIKTQTDEVNEEGVKVEVTIGVDL